MSPQTTEASKRAMIYLITGISPIVIAVLSGNFGPLGAGGYFRWSDLLLALWPVVSTFLIRALGEGGFDSARATSGDVIAGDVRSKPKAAGSPIR